MNMKFWFAYKLLMGNWKRAVFPFLGVMGGVAALIMSLSLGAGGERIISNDLSTISENRIMIGGANMDMRDIEILESYPMVQYAVFPEARTVDGTSIFKGYPPKAISTLGLRQLQDGEIILDKNQFPDKKQGDFIKIFIDNREYNFLIKDMYEEKNPFELMRNGNRIILSQSYYQRIFEKYTYREIIISFDKNEDAEEYIPYILEKFNRSKLEKVQLLETPEVYKRVVKIQKIVKNILTLLSIISLGIGGFGIMNLIAGGVKARTVHIGILRAIGMARKDISKIFLAEGVIIAIVGAITGIIFGIAGAFIGGKIIMIPPVFNVFQIFIFIAISLVFGIGIGVFPAKKAGEMSITDALREQ